MTTDSPKPDYARNMRIVGHTDQGGRPDGVQVMVHRGYAYIGHMFSKGFSIVDVRDPRHLQPVNYVPAPPGTWNIHLQTHDNLLPSTFEGPRPGQGRFRRSPGEKLPT